MTEVTAQLRYLRMAPKKVRGVASTLRGLPVQAASSHLSFFSRAAADPLKKLLASAVANAEHNFKLRRENLFVHRLEVNEGPSLKRMLPRARGRADVIKKRMSHITIVLSDQHDRSSKSKFQSSKQDPKS